MSGSGQASFRAPSALSAPTGDQPLTNTDGRPTFYMLQWMQRIQSYLGQPTDPPAGYYTITEQLNGLASDVAAATFAGSAAQPSSGLTTRQAIEAAAKVGNAPASSAAPSAGAIAAYRAQIWFAAGQG